MKKYLIVLFSLLLLSACEAPSVEMELQPGNDIIAYGEDWNDGGCLIIINDEVHNMKRTTEVDILRLGETVVQYQYTVRSEIYECARVVKVIDVHPPQGFLNPGVDTIVLGEIHIDAGITVTDDLDESPMIVVDNRVNTSMLGTYMIFYTITDTFGNETIVQRYVHVIANTN